MVSWSFRLVYEQFHYTQVSRKATHTPHLARDVFEPKHPRFNPDLTNRRKESIVANKNTAVFGIYKSVAQAERAVATLTSAGFANNDISVLLADAQSSH